MFTAHLANWELPPVIAVRGGLDVVVLYRRPNLAAIAEAVIRLRSGLMGQLLPATPGAPVGLLHALEDGRHVGMLVDQHYTKGVAVKFFGRRCWVNPLLALLARKVECPIYGTRVWRLPGNRFAAEVTDEVPPVRDAEGLVDVVGTMQAVTDVVEAWVREHPEQWLWLHRRWRQHDPEKLETFRTRSCAKSKRMIPKKPAPSESGVADHSHPLPSARAKGVALSGELHREP